MNPADVIEPADSRTRDHSQERTPLYRPLDFVMVRAPLLPVQSYLDLASEPRQLSLSADPRVRRAIAVASTSLLGAMERSQHAGLSQRDAARMRAKLLRYQIRMSTRPTPFGLFAGVALGSWGPATDIQIHSTCAFTRTRPDMAWLMTLVLSAEANPAIRKRLRFFANPLAVVEAGRVTLSEPAPTAKVAHSAPVSIRATGVVKRALAVARTPISYDDLVAQLCETTASATPEKLDKLLSELWEQTFLLTDLRPPVTTNSPAQYVAQRLASIPEASEVVDRLNGLLNASSEWDHLEGEDSAVAFGKLVARTGDHSDDSQPSPVQVDMAMSLVGRVGKCDCYGSGTCCRATFASHSRAPRAVLSGLLSADIYQPLRTGTGSAPARIAGPAPRPGTVAEPRPCAGRTGPGEGGSTSANALRSGMLRFARSSAGRHSRRQLSFPARNVAAKS